MLTESSVLEALRPVQDPELNRSVVDLQMVKSVSVNDHLVRVTVAMPSPEYPLRSELRDRVSAAVSAIPGVGSVAVDLAVMSEAEQKALAGKMGQSEGHRSMRTAVNAVADALTAHGFAAHTEADGEQLQIISQQCPFGEAAQQFPHVVCAVDRGMIRGMLAALYGETNPHFSASRPAGDANCITCV